MLRFFLFLKVYWKSIFIVIYPLILLPIFRCNDQLALRCMYVVCLMAGYWILEVLPLPITSLIPVVLFPIMGIMETKSVCLCYFEDAIMMFVGGLVIALAIEYCKLHIRIALLVIKLVGCSYRRLHLGFTVMTFFVSLWISNTGATAMMIPIIEATLTELQEQGMGQMYEDNTVEEENRKPSRPTMCFYIGTAYAASIGGMGCLVGSGTNLAFVGIFDLMFPEAHLVNFNTWLASCFPIALVIMILTWVWLEIWYMGLFRPKSRDAQLINVGKEGEEVARGVIKGKLDEMGQVTLHEILVGILFLVVVVLWVFRAPKIIHGWEYIFNEEIRGNPRISDSTAAIFIVILIFIFPAQATCLYFCGKDEENIPKAASPALLPWKFVKDKMHWGLIFLMGGGFAISKASNASGMSTLIAEKLDNIRFLPKYAILSIICLSALGMTQISSNVAIANILLPVVSKMCTAFKIHPLYMMLPVALSCSFAYCMPVATPPNAIAAAPCNMTTWEMIKVGVMVEIISFLVLIGIFPLWGQVIFKIDHFPKWAANKKP